MGDSSSNQLMKNEGTLFTLLKSERTLIEEPLSDYINSEVLKNAERRIKVCLRGEEPDECEGWLAEILNPESIKQQYEHFPFEPEQTEHMRRGTKWWKDLSSCKDLHSQLTDPHVRRSALFVARTFCYLAYANITGYTFTPDALRSDLVTPILQKEKLFLDDLMSTLKSSYKPHGTSPELESMISPFSVIVFERSRRKENIVAEMQALRIELKPTRQKLQELEWEALAKGVRHSDKVKTKWKAILREVEKTFGGGAASFDYDKAADLTGSAAKVVTNPYGVEAWLKMLKKPAEIVNRIVNKGPLIAIHRLYPQLGGSERAEKAIHRLFETNK